MIISDELLIVRVTAVIKKFVSSIELNVSYKISDLT